MAKGGRGQSRSRLWPKWVVAKAGTSLPPFGETLSLYQCCRSGTQLMQPCNRCAAIGSLPSCAIDLDQIVDGPRPRGADNDGHIFEESEQELTVLHLFLYFSDRVATGHTEQEWRDGIALLAPLMLAKLVRVSFSVCPLATRWASVRARKATIGTSKSFDNIDDRNTWS